MVDRYKPSFERLYDRDDLYLLGLEKLQQINPNLQFITPGSYRQTVKLALTEKEQDFLKQAVKNQFKLNI